MKRAALAGFLLLLISAWAPPIARAEYCIDWKPWLAKYAGQSGHCWPTLAECNAYHSSRCLNPNYRNDCAGGCYYKPGLYPRAGTGKEGGSNPPADGPSDSAAAAQKKFQELKREQDAAQQRDFQRAVNDLKKQMKVPPEGTAPKQLKDLAGSGSLAARDLDAPGSASPERDEQARVQAGWPGVRQAPPPVFTAPKPVAVPADGTGTKAIDLRALLEAIAAKRREVAQQDEEIRTLERNVEEARTRETADPAAESDALRKAREALARAKANREKTRAELERMEREESAGRTSSTGAAP